MLVTAVKFLGGLISKEILIDLFKDVVLEFAFDLLSEFVASTENTYDDKLLEKFEEFLSKRDEA